jgi:hypothetical protein
MLARTQLKIAKDVLHHVILTFEMGPDRVFVVLSEIRVEYRVRSAEVFKTLESWLLEILSVNREFPADRSGGRSTRLI